MSDTVTVICKIPQGMILELGLVKNATGHTCLRGPNYEQHRVAGFNAELRKWFQGQIIPTIAPPAGRTQVPRAFAEEWFRRNSHLRIVRDGLLTMLDSTKPAEVAAAARDAESRSCGLEPKDGDKLVQGVDRADFQKAIGA